MKDFSRLQPTFQLRRIAACNLVKKAVLGGENIPGDFQADLMLSKLDELAEKQIDRRTWLAWMLGRSQFKDKNMLLLDRAYKKATGEDGFITSLIQADLSDGQDGVWSINLHFDALDAAGYWGGGSEQTWSLEKQKRIERVFSWLHSIWNPSSGAIYNSFRSDFKIEYDMSSCEEKEQIRVSLAKFQPDPFDVLMNEPPRPSSDLIQAFDVFSPVRIWEFLLAMAEDHKFLVEERFEHWALDLASASAALYGLAYLHRYETFGSIRPNMESHIASGLYDLFWEEETDFDTVLWRMGIGEKWARVEAAGKLSHLWQARLFYQKTLGEMGLTVSAVADVMKRQWTEMPITYVVR